MVYGTINPGLEDCTYSYNQADYGNDIFTRPYQLRLRIYEFEETFPYPDQRSLEAILSDAKTVISIFII